MSWQLRLLNVQLRLVAKRTLARLPDVATARRRLDAGARWSFRPTPLTRHFVRPGDLHWIGSGPAQAGRVILYFHGGGYIAGSPSTHEGMIARIARLSGIEVCAPQYRLAPDTPFPGAHDDALAAWDQLQAMGYAPGDIVLGGDSAGGGLALALLAQLCARGEPPRAIFAMSPWTDLTLSGASLSENAKRDAMLPVGRIEELREYYLQGADADDPRASPLFADFPGCPPVLLHYSMSEVLRDDTLRMEKHLQAQGAEVDVEAQEDAPHVWHLFDGWIPEARDSLRRIARFVQVSFEDTSR
ncbi:alpha/beta hydrolase [Tropicibacter oceani]|uniref:Alpha/beta hydrolase n=1 Tax=Tropicibacter oceani TaxID=3058420 RepID=A0ABY8QL65_9RHOB|nr:alpha/beta hydrolase [Tropicibacter oceani]WGW05374.1 alpha/beta hydrolase [Tropicibacter oceani]